MSRHGLSAARLDKILMQIGFASERLWRANIAIHGERPFESISRYDLRYRVHARLPLTPARHAALFSFSLSLSPSLSLSLSLSLFLSLYPCSHSNEKKDHCPPDAACIVCVAAIPQ